MNIMEYLAATELYCFLSEFEETITERTEIEYGSFSNQMDINMINTNILPFTQISKHVFAEMLSSSTLLPTTPSGQKIWSRFNRIKKKHVSKSRCIYIVFIE